MADDGPGDGPDGGPDCPWCDQAFESFDALQEHVAEAHEEET